MSEPTYRIETEHDPSYSAIPWSAYIWRISDETKIGRGDGLTREAALEDAQRIIAAKRAEQYAPQTFYADENGGVIHDLTPEPQSLRA